MATVSSIYATLRNTQVPPGNPFRSAAEKFMKEDLARSGLTPEVMLAFPIVKNGMMHPGWPDGAPYGYAIPYWDLDGRPLMNESGGVHGQMYRIRLFFPDTVPPAERKNKYWGPSRRMVGAACRLPYLPPGRSKCERWIIVEGEKKALKVWDAWKVVGVIGIGGCQNWRSDEGNGVHEWILEALTRGGAREVFIVPDGDVRKLDINRAYRGLAEGLQQAGYEVVVVDTAQVTEEGAAWKIDDWLAAGGDGGRGSLVLDDWPQYDVAGMVESQRELRERYNLTAKVTDAGVVTIDPNEANVIELLEHHPTYAGDVRLNTDLATYVVGDYNVATSYVEVCAHMQRSFGIRTLSPSVVKRAIDAVAQRNHYSSRQKLLSDLEKRWDGKKRLERLLVNYMGAADSPYAREVGLKWMVGAVARVRHPGCRVDFMLILVGPQNIGKSAFFQILWGRHGVGEGLVEFRRGMGEGKDLEMLIARSWCFCDEELGGLGKAEQSRLKATITTTATDIRLPYAVAPIHWKRRNVFSGTTDKAEGFLQRDEAGQRRFCPVPVAQCQFKELEKDAVQLWAEAAVLESRGGVDYAQVTGATDVARQYEQESEWEGPVEEALKMLRNQYKDRRDHGGAWWFRWAELQAALRVVGRDVHFKNQIAEVRGIVLQYHGFTWERQSTIARVTYKSVFKEGK